MSSSTELWFWLCLFHYFVFSALCQEYWGRSVGACQDCCTASSQLSANFQTNECNLGCVELQDCSLRPTEDAQVSCQAGNSFRISGKFVVPESLAGETGRIAYCSEVGKAQGALHETYAQEGVCKDCCENFVDYYNPSLSDSPCRRDGCEDAACAEGADRISCQIGKDFLREGRTFLDGHEITCQRGNARNGYVALKKSVLSAFACRSCCNLANSEFSTPFDNDACRSIGCLKDVESCSGLTEAARFGCLIGAGFASVASIVSPDDDSTRFYCIDEGNDDIVLELTKISSISCESCCTDLTNLDSSFPASACDTGCSAEDCSSFVAGDEKVACEKGMEIKQKGRMVFQGQNYICRNGLTYHDVNLDALLTESPFSPSIPTPASSPGILSAVDGRIVASAVLFSLAGSMTIFIVIRRKINTMEELRFVKEEIEREEANNAEHIAPQTLSGSPSAESTSLSMTKYYDRLKSLKSDESTQV